MYEPSITHWVIIGSMFAWSGFVRSGIGFGGAALTLPLLLLVHESPIFFLPIISWHLLFFASLTLRDRYHNIEYKILGKSLLVMIVPKIVGILGLLSLPDKIMSIIIYSITLAYAISYVLKKPFVSKNKASDGLVLAIGGYISGTSLIGAPLIVAVMSKYISKLQLRDTLFALWIILVSIKMSAFTIAGVDLQITNSIWLLLPAWVGHYFGLKAHDKMLTTDDEKFKQIIGSILLIICLLGFIRLATT